MMARCYNANHKQWEDYGGRGITVCEEWRDDKSTFFNWAKANGYREGLWLERERNNEGYSPDNCIWSTPKTQANNRRNNRSLTAFGETKLLTEWILDPRCKATYSGLVYRLNSGWTAQQALMKDSQNKKLRKIPSKNTKVSEKTADLKGKDPDSRI